MRIPDRFLFAHHLGDGLFDISRNLAPVSARDQIVRGRVFADRAFRLGLISPDRPLVTIGCGAAGATAAIRAAELKVKSILVEREPGPFPLQTGCTTRCVDPAIYDWPEPRWTNPSMTDLNLSWSAGPADEVALAWTDSLEQTRNSLGKYLDVRFNSWPVGEPRPVRAHRILIQRIANAAGIVRERCGIVLTAVGLGRELECAGFHGTPFWQDDDFGQPAAGLPDPDMQAVVIGGGDGALQDLMRLLTGRNSAREILAECRLPDHVAAALLSTLPDVHRVGHWDAWDDHGVHQRAEEFMSSLIDDVLQRPEVRDGVAGLLQHRAPPLHIVHPCDHFTCLYGLNRFLGLLLVRACETLDLRPVQRWSRSRVTSIDCRGHAHDKDQPIACHGQPHTVTLARHEDCRCRATLETDHEPLSNVGAIAVRIGIGFEESTRPFQRQVLPRPDEILLE